MDECHWKYAAAEDKQADSKHMLAKEVRKWIKKWKKYRYTKIFLILTRNTKRLFNDSRSNFLRKSCIETFIDKCN